MIHLQTIKNKRIVIVLIALFLLTSNVLLGQDRYVRPVSLPKGTEAKVICIVDYEDGTRIIEDKERTDAYTLPKGEPQRKSYFLLMDGMWMETTESGKGDMKVGEMVLPLDKVKFKGELVSNHTKREAYNGHEPLDFSVKNVKTEYKYKDTMDLDPSLKDSVLKIVNRIIIHCDEENAYNFRIVVNDTLLLPPEYSVDTVDCNDIDLSSELKILGIPDSIALKRVVVIPNGHVPTVIKDKDIKCENIIDKSTLPFYENQNHFRKWIILGAIVIIGALAFLLIRRRNNGSERGAGKDIFDKEEQEIICCLKDEKIKLKKRIKELEDETQQEREKKEKIIDNLKDEKRSLEHRLKEVKADSDNRIQVVRKEEREKYESAINKLEKEKKDLEDSLKSEKEEAEKQIKAAHEEERTIADKELYKLKESHRVEVERLEEEQRIYSEKIAFVPFATQYAKDIYTLIDTVNEINRQAKELANTEVDDSYLIFKAIGKFNLVHTEIDYEGFLTDVSLAAKNEMSFTNSGITNLKSVSADQMFSSLRSYFLSAYLEKFINAAVVYNESLAGIDRLVNGISSSMTAPFKKYRETLMECCKRLGIAVISVKLFDTLGDNVDLKAEMIDFDDRLPADSIIAIDNCLVYPEGGRRPTEKIYVKAQK